MVSLVVHWQQTLQQPTLKSHLQRHHLQAAPNDQQPGGVVVEMFKVLAVYVTQQAQQP